MTLSHDLNPILVAPRPVNAFSFARAPVSASPSPSRAASLPSDALEEFLAILKPSPKARRALNFQYDRALPRQRADEKQDKSKSPDGEIRDIATELQEQDAFNRWPHYMVMSSPVSRNHTRNPFFKHVSDMPAPPLSPSAIPLPTPSPDELLEIF